MTGGIWPRLSSTSLKAGLARDNESSAKAWLEPGRPNFPRQVTLGWRERKKTDLTSDCFCSENAFLWFFFVHRESEKQRPVSSDIFSHQHTYIGGWTSLHCSSLCLAWALYNQVKRSLSFFRINPQGAWVPPSPPQKSPTRLLCEPPLIIKPVKWLWAHLMVLLAWVRMLTLLVSKGQCQNLSHLWKLVVLESISDRTSARGVNASGEKKS